jgi:signal transduction histidine kinase/DNA-binding response OmpR family regulator
VLGTICAADTVPRTYSDEVVKVLEKIAILVTAPFEARVLSKRLSEEVERRSKREVESEMQARALRLLAEGAELSQVLQAINDMLERQIPQAMASILLVDGGVFRVGAASSLPSEFVQKLDGFPINASVGACGSAVTNRRTHITEDVFTDRVWAGYEDELQSYGLRSVWSIPIFDVNGEVVATFGVYFSEPKAVDTVLLRHVTNAADIVGISLTNRRVQDDLRTARNEAVRASKHKTELLANMSHEIRTPLNGIIGTAQLLADTDMTGEQQHLLSTMQSSADGLLAIINDVLDLSKIEAGKLEACEEEFDLCAVTEGVAATFQALAFQKRIRIDVQLDNFLSSGYRGDMIRFRQILTNLVSNAIKFTDVGGVTIRVRPINPFQGIVLTVTDTGIGIPKHRHEAIFDSFTQADGSTARKFGGTGLGLTIVKKLVNLLGGEISVQSAEGSGTTFRVTFPTFVALAEYLSANRPSQDLPDRINLHVMLVEDNPVNRLVVEKMLVSLGCTVITAENAYDAIDLHRNIPGEMILMDVQMPEMDGYEATRRIRAIDAGRGRYTPVIAFTAHAMPGDRKLAFESGMDDHVAKPVRRTELVDALLRNIESGRTHR